MGAAQVDAVVGQLEAVRTQRPPWADVATARGWDTGVFERPVTVAVTSQGAVCAGWCVEASDAAARPIRVPSWAITHAAALCPCLVRVVPASRSLTVAAQSPPLSSEDVMSLVAVSRVLGDTAGIVRRLQGGPSTAVARIDAGTCLTLVQHLDILGRLAVDPAPAATVRGWVGPLLQDVVDAVGAAHGPAGPARMHVGVGLRPHVPWQVWAAAPGFARIRTDGTDMVFAALLDRDATPAPPAPPAVSDDRGVVVVADVDVVGRRSGSLLAAAELAWSLTTSGADLDDAWAAATAVC